MELTSRLRTMARSRPSIVDGYERRGSKMRRSRAWIPTRCMMAYLSTSSSVDSPFVSSSIHVLDASFFFASDEASCIMVAISPAFCHTTKHATSNLLHRQDAFLSKPVQIWRNRKPSENPRRKSRTNMLDCKNGWKEI